MSPRLAPLLLALLLPLAAQAKRDPAEAAYQEARRSYYTLKDDAARRKLRHHWLKVAHQFESVYSRFPKSQRAPEALYTAAELLNDLSRISFVPEDQQAAIADYSRVVESHPRHRLADDAAYMLARIYFEQLDQPESARRVLNGILAANPKGDRAKDLKALLALLPAPKTPAPVRKAPARAPEPPPAPEPRPAVASAEPPKPAPAEKQPPVEKQPVDKQAPAEQVPVIHVELSKPAEPEPTKVAQAPQPAPVPESKPVVEPAKPVTAPVDEKMAQARLKAVAKASNGTELTLAEQLGLKVRRVVIDAGHGGHDTGAIGRKGTREKDVTLAIARKLANELRNRGLEVMLTREDDHYLKLEERARMANEMKGDLFISIHCNSAHTSKLRGIETYTLNTSADRYSIRLAARENASSEKGISDLQFILADLATKANTEESTRLATRVQKNLVSHLSSSYSGVKDLGTKEALFYVLLGAKMPAILVEASFLSNSEEEQRLASEKYQDDVAQAIAHGVEDFLGGRQVAKVQVN
ncbi:N-acetylmuramoyl-L-alanine amidase [Archangium lipolyticum]|uniref:N-acetylmuramoyl-L-alanine amidase n=1 Tax=Archangium lipolyticum TaxID=2970465 RepID=UPI00214A78BC|nr:N-acetylmuramoyl-L-alanine amidase [Archangium lipolyticum]